MRITLGFLFKQVSQPTVLIFVKDRKITQYFLKEDRTGIERIRVLLPDDPLLAQPTTGTVASDRFYFIDQPVAGFCQALSGKQWRGNSGSTVARTDWRTKTLMLPLCLFLFRLPFRGQNFVEKESTKTTYNRYGGEPHDQC